MAVMFQLFVSCILLRTVVVLGLNLDQKHLRDLRQFRVDGLGARIAVSSVEELLHNLTDGCDLDLYPTNEGIPNGEYELGQLFFGYGYFHDHTLTGLSCNMKKRVATSYHIFGVDLPFVTGGHPGYLNVVQFTDSDKNVFFPYNTNSDFINYIDDIREDENGTIVLRHGTDVMVLKVEHNETCRQSQQRQVAEDFDRISGKPLTSTNYPLPFDWGCGLFGDEVDFCDILEQNENDMKQAGGNVCTEVTTSNQSTQCPATLQILEMTGFFKNALPFFSAPSESFEAEWTHKEHGSGIVYPCINTN